MGFNIHLLSMTPDAKICYRLRQKCESTGKDANLVRLAQLACRIA